MAANAENPKLFSVIIPNLNTPGVGQAIDSLENQTFDRDRYEVIVVGMDRYGAVTESDLVCFDRSETPLAPAAARNRGARRASGEVLVFMDADCIASSDWLAEFARLFASSQVHVAGGGVWFQAQNYWTLADNLSMFYEFLHHHAPGLRPQLPSLNLAVRKADFLAIGGFDERYPRAAGEDADLTLRLRQAGFQLYFEPRAAVQHAPSRDRLSNLLRHAYYQGMYSTKVDPRYQPEEGNSWFLRGRLRLRLFAPLIALGATWRVFTSHPQMLRFRYTAPAIYLAKIAWCLGAARHPRDF